MRNFEDEALACIRQYHPSAIPDGNSSFSTLPGKTIFIKDKNLVFHLIPIPFDGLQNIPSGYFQERSLEYAGQGLQLVHLWQDHWEKRTEIVRSRIAALLGKGIRIHARKTEVQRIAKEDMRHFFGANHLHGYVNSRYSYGLCADGRLVAVASFSGGRNMPRNGITGRSFELLRYSSLLHHNVVGGIGKLTACFIKEYRPDDIMTYADLDWASGKGYRALGFEQVAVTPPQMFWIHPGEMTRYYPHRLPEQLTDAFARQNETDSMDEFLLNRGYVRIYNAGNLKFVKIRH